jgi:hypothetical protein
MANKMDLVDKVAAAIGCTKADAERAVEAMIDSVTNWLRSGEEVSVAGRANRAQPAYRRNHSDKVDAHTEVSRFEDPQRRGQIGVFCPISRENPPVRRVFFVGRAKVGYSTGRKRD